MTGQQRAVAVLLAVEVAEQGKEVLRVVLVHGRVGRRADHHQCKRRVAQNNHQDRQAQGVGHHPAFAAREVDQKAQSAQHQQAVDQYAGVEAHAQVVDKQQLKPSGHVDQAFDHTREHQTQ